MRESRRSTESGETHTSLLARLLTELWAYPKPVLCRVGGPVRGGGIVLVACCDVVVATGAASFAFSEVRVGVAPAMVAAVALRKVPLGLLLPSLLTGEPFDARAAERLGLVSSVSDDDGALGRVADAILLGAPGALRTTKSLARDLAGASVADVLRETQSLSAALFADAEAQEGMAAFAERRPPSWIVTT
jgi:methylglutaconyl-CoA hydratase